MIRQEIVKLSIMLFFFPTIGWQATTDSDIAAARNTHRAEAPLQQARRNAGHSMRDVAAVSGIIATCVTCGVTPK